MDLYKDILIKALSKHGTRVTFENLATESPNGIVEQTCYATLQQIREILNDNQLDDFECIERIADLFEDIGSNGGTRHDFG